VVVLQPADQPEVSSNTLVGVDVLKRIDMTCPAMAAWTRPATSRCAATDVRRGLVGRRAHASRSCARRGLTRQIGPTGTGRLEPHVHRVVPLSSLCRS
jgi:hypothetical protein